SNSATAAAAATISPPAAGSTDDDDEDDDAVGSVSKTLDNDVPNLDIDANAHAHSTKKKTKKRGEAGEESSGDTTPTDVAELEMDLDGVDGLGGRRERHSRID